jgi:hypothetical protein
VFRNGKKATGCVEADFRVRRLPEKRGRQLALGNKAKAPATPGANSFRSRGITGDIPFDPRGFGRGFPRGLDGDRQLKSFRSWDRAKKHSACRHQQSAVRTRLVQHGLRIRDRYPGVPMRIPIGTLAFAMGMPQGMPAYRCVWLGIVELKTHSAFSRQHSDRTLNWSWSILCGSLAFERLGSSLPYGPQWIRSDGGAECGFSPKFTDNSLLFTVPKRELADFGQNSITSGSNSKNSLLFSLFFDFSCRAGSPWDSGWKPAMPADNWPTVRLQPAGQKC